MKIRLSKSYSDKKVFENFSLEVGEGEVLCVLGKSGVGKTTLLNALAGLIAYEGNIENLPKEVGYIFQEPRLLPNLTVEQNLRYAGGRVEDIDEILHKIGLFELKNKRPKFLSGGERQRVSIARAFLSDAKLLLMDEPFSSLDTALKIRLSETFAALWKEKRPTTIFVTHDLEEGLMLAHRIVVLSDGKVVKDMRLQGEIPRPYGENAEAKKELLQVLLRG